MTNYVTTIQLDNLNIWIEVGLSRIEFIGLDIPVYSDDDALVTVYVGMWLGKSWIITDSSKVAWKQTSFVISDRTTNRIIGLDQLSFNECNTGAKIDHTIWNDRKSL